MFGNRETLVVFDGGRSALAFKALDVTRMTASELWLGQPPLPLGTLLGVGAGVLDSRTRVLELETGAGRAVPVLARGVMSLRTVASSALQAFVPPASFDEELTACVRAVMLADNGDRSTYVVDPSGLLELFRRHSSTPPARAM